MVTRPKNAAQRPIQGEEDAFAGPRLVQMVRDGQPPNTAQVHPDEVENYAKGGWRRADGA